MEFTESCVHFGDFGESEVPCNFVNAQYIIYHWIPLIKSFPTIYGFVYIGHIGGNICHFVYRNSIDPPSDKED